MHFGQGLLGITILAFKKITVVLLLSSLGVFSTVWGHFATFCKHKNQFNRLRSSQAIEIEKEDLSCNVNWSGDNGRSLRLRRALSVNLEGCLQPGKGEQGPALMLCITKTIQSQFQKTF